MVLQVSSWKLLCGDALAELAKLPEQSVQTCITSPPYYGLRDYGVEGQIGLEETPEQYILKLVEVFAGAGRVLRDDGTLWIVIGDSYATTHQGKHGKQHGSGFHATGETYSESVAVRRTHAVPFGCKPKDLLGIPWMLAFALREAGWYLRSEIIWAKSISGPVYRGGSCMPEAVTDRPTKSHETIFLLSKQERYFFAQEAIKEPAHDWSRGGPGEGIKKTKHYAPANGGNAGLGQLAARYRTGTVEPKRNMRSVWHVNPRAFKGAHFATFPSELIEPMLRAGSRPGDMVLDPFSGAGTTALVAVGLGRDALGIELNPEYVALARKRMADAGFGDDEDGVEMVEAPVDFSGVCWGEDPEPDVEDEP